MHFLKQRIFTLLLIFSPGISLAQAVMHKIVSNGNGFVLLRNGQPYYIKGAGGDTHLGLLSKCGGNSIRTWGVEHAGEILDSAQAHGLTVMLGLWMQHERHGFDYSDTEKVRQQFNHFKSVVDKYKNHPALLLWGIGNEVDLFYSNTNVWHAINEVAKYIHQVDPNHPTSTVTAGLDSLEVAEILQKAPEIDIYCVNTYGDIANVPQNIRKFGWKGPYMITEWGPNGHWESPVTSWNAAMEQSSSEKAKTYYERYTKYIEPYQGENLGSYVFLWGQKQEYTETWYGLFTKNEEPTEAIDYLQKAWAPTLALAETPGIGKFLMNGQSAFNSVTLLANTENTASVELLMSEKAVENGKPLKGSVQWRLLAESNDKKAGGDVEQEATEIPFRCQQSNTPNIRFKAPDKPGEYRLFFTYKLNGKVAYGNFPFMVNANPVRGNGRKIWIKTWKMEDENHD